MKNPNQPREYDAVKGGQIPTPIDGVILGGLEGVKKRLASTFEEQRIAALSDALKYEEAGLDLVIQALQDESGYVRVTAYSLLQERAEPRVKQALMEIVNKYLASPDINCKIDALKEAIKYGNEGLDLLIQALEDESKQVEAAAYSLLREREETRAKQALVKIVKKYLASTNITWRIDTLKEAVKCGNEGLDLVIQALKDESEQVEAAAYSLLRGREEPRVKYVLQQHNPWGLFDCLCTLKGHLGSVNSLAISPDGITLVSDSSVQTSTWILTTGYLLKVINKGRCCKSNDLSRKRN